MVYQLSSGRTIEISVEQYLDMSDEELNYLNTYGVGESIEDPWHGSVLSRKSFIEDEDYYIQEITDISIEEKYEDLDIDPDIVE